MTGHCDTEPHTLADAHRTHMRSWPGETGSPEAFAAYYRHGEALFAAVADIDADHRQEALWWAGECRRLATLYAVADPTDSSGERPGAGPE